MSIFKRIKRIGRDIRTGQNIDVYIAIVISIIVALLSLLGIINQTIILSALLTIMAIVPYSMLANRQQNEELMAVLSNLKETRSLATKFFHKEDNITEIVQAIRNSQEIVLWGYVLSTHLPYLAETIEKNLPRGLQVTILLLKPSGIAIEMAAFRSQSRINKNKLNKNLEDNLELLEEIKKRWPSAKFEYKVIDYLAPYTMYMYDPYHSTGKIMVKLSAFEANMDERPAYYLTKQDDAFWFQFHLNQFETAWKKAQTWVK